MPIYISLMKLTGKGIEDIKNAPERIAAGVKALEEMGGKLLGFYTVMGEYDYIGIAEAPSDEVAMTYLIGLAADGLVRTKTMRAFTVEQLAEMVKKLP